MAPLILDPAKGAVQIPPQSEVLQDPSGRLRIGQVSSLPWAGRFEPLGAPQFNKGHSRSAWWLRFRLARPKSALHHGDWFLEAAKPGLGQVDLYTPKSGGGWLVKKTGAERPLESREFAHRSFVVRLPQGFDESRYFYLRIKSNVSINLAITVWTAKNLSWDSVLDFFAFGAAYGSMAAMLVYNLMIFFFLRDRVYLYYVLYMCTSIACLGFIYGHIPTFFSTPSSIFWLSMGLHWLVGGAFVRSSLDTAKNTPKLDKAILALMALSPFVILLALTGQNFWANMLNNFITIPAPALIISTAIIIWRKGEQTAGYFVAAWLIVALGTTLYCIGGILLPRTLITRYTLAVGSPLESLLLSMALASRIQAMRARQERLSRERRELKQLSQIDGLTGLLNRRVFNEELARETDNSLRGRQPLSLVMMDVDNFKIFNDAHGHPEGDKVLKALGQVLHRCARESDTAYRYGGEEFSLLLPGADQANALAVAERIRRGFAEIVFNTAAGEAFSATVSLGVASLLDDESGTDLLKKADSALYQAKRQGKNRVTAAG